MGKQNFGQWTSCASKTLVKNMQRCSNTWTLPLFCGYSLEKRRRKDKDRGVYFWISHRHLLFAVEARDEASNSRQSPCKWSDAFADRSVGRNSPHLWSQGWRGRIYSRHTVTLITMICIFWGEGIHRERGWGENNFLVRHTLDWKVSIMGACVF